MSSTPALYIKILFTMEHFHLLKFGKKIRYMLIFFKFTLRSKTIQIILVYRDFISNLSVQNALLNPDDNFYA